jgi:hypothetical protein
MQEQESRTADSPRRKMKSISAGNGNGATPVVGYEAKTRAPRKTELTDGIREMKTRFAQLLTKENPRSLLHQPRNTKTCGDRRPEAEVNHEEESSGEN